MWHLTMQVVPSGNQTWQWKIHHLWTMFPLKPPFISIHRRFPIAMFDYRPRSAAISHLSAPPLSQPCRCLLSSACARAAQGWLCFNSWGKWDVPQSTGAAARGTFTEAKRNFCWSIDPLRKVYLFLPYVANRWNYKSKWLPTGRTFPKQTYLAIWPSARSTPRKVASGSVQTALHLQRLQAPKNHWPVTAKTWHQIDCLLEETQGNIKRKPCLSHFTYKAV